MECAVLRDACLKLGEPQPTCSSSCKNRPFRITAHGDDAQAQVASALRFMRPVADPIHAVVPRHLERDVFAAPGESPSRSIVPGSQLSMVWPAWEGGFGDLLMWTILPLGLALHEGSLPNDTLAISGALYTRAWQPLLRARRICTFERYDTYEVPDGAQTIREYVTNPLPRCAPEACYEVLRLCRPRPVHGADSWRASARCVVSARACA